MSCSKHTATVSSISRWCNCRLASFRSRETSFCVAHLPQAVQHRSQCVAETPNRQSVVGARLHSSLPQSLPLSSNPGRQDKDSVLTSLPVFAKDARRTCDWSSIDHPLGGRAFGLSRTTRWRTLSARASLRAHYKALLQGDALRFAPSALQRMPRSPLRSAVVASWRAKTVPRRPCP